MDDLEERYRPRDMRYEQRHEKRDRRFDRDCWRGDRYGYNDEYEYDYRNYRALIPIDAIQHGLIQNKNRSGSRKPLGISS